MLPATPAFNDSTCGVCGIATNSSACASTARGRPEPSLPTKTADGAGEIRLIERRAFVR